MNKKVKHFENSENLFSCFRSLDVASIPLICPQQETDWSRRGISALFQKFARKTYQTLRMTFNRLFLCKHERANIYRRINFGLDTSLDKMYHSIAIECEQ